MVLEFCYFFLTHVGVLCCLEGRFEGAGEPGWMCTKNECLKRWLPFCHTVATTTLYLSILLGLVGCQQERAKTDLS